MSQSDREFDLILWGATGFTGQLVAEHLIAHYGPDSLRWALGGRNESKLAAVRDRLGALDLPLVLGDAGNDEKMASLAQRARVVCTTVGPYARYGSRLLSACAAAGTHYCDLTGELHWIRRMLDAHQSQAEASGARIVPTCGFDSIPSDLGVLFLQREMRSRYGAPSSHVKCGVAGFSGAMSGGTVASMLNMMDEGDADAFVGAEDAAAGPESRGHGCRPTKRSIEELPPVDSLHHRSFRLMVEALHPALSRLLY